VDNEPAAFMARAGSTPRGYTRSQPTGRARRAPVDALLENDYGLHEVTPGHQPLHMHCAVLEVPKGGDRAALLAAWRDRRVKLAEPLQSFVTRTDAYNDPYVGLQRGFQQMDVADAHPWSRGEGSRWPSSIPAPILVIPICREMLRRGEFCRRG